MVLNKEKILINILERPKPLSEEKKNAVVTKSRINNKKGTRS